MGRFVRSWAIVGAVVPFVFLLAWSLIQRYPSIDRSVHGILFKLQLIVWPGSLFEIGAEMSGKAISWGAIALGVLVNILLYALIGFLIWVASRR